MINELHNTDTAIFSAPLVLYGEGSYSLSSVKVIDGTDDYIYMAEKGGQCQDKESYQACLSREYLRQGLDQCSCTPYKFRNYAKGVIKPL